jgi:two-component system chemotaxis sensor kinase CheA
MSDNKQLETLIDPDMREIVESFLVETKEILDKLDFDLLELEKRPEDSELLNQIFRSFHTIKGTSGFLGLEKLPEVTHKCEDILNKLRKGELKLSTPLMDGIILGFDTIKELVAKIENDKNEEVDTRNVNLALEALLPNDNAEKFNDDDLAKMIAQNNATKESDVSTQPSTQGVNEVTPQEIISAKENSNNLSEIQVENISQKVEIPKPDAQKKKATETVADNTIRVDVERLDNLLDIVSEIVLGRNRLAQVNSEFGIANEGSKYSKDFGEVTKQIDLMTTELQLVAMKLRMIKIGKIFNRYPRLVRDLCKDLGKEVDLLIVGEETEVDKNLIEEINDPLVHLIRNSVDHGVEMPDVREKAGKPRKGTVTLSAEHLGNNIQISIEDDGKGINPDVIKEKAISKGLISKERAKDLSRQEILNLIFLPGFSTAEKVSNVSGRGVGMDVVKTNVARLRGIINIESETGKGTKIIIKLPLTLAIIPGMIVKVRGEALVIPLGSVIEVIRVNKNQIHTIKGTEVINVRNSVLPIVSMENLLSSTKQRTYAEEPELQYVVEVGIAEKRYGIKVDELIGQQEVVIKSLGGYLGKIDGLAGSTIMGDGTVVIIIDINELFHKLEMQS